MRDGFYLATYLEINALANIYGYAQRHDQNISLWKKTGEEVELVHYWELERVSGKKKHKIAFIDVAQAKRVINQLLAEYNLTIDDMNEVWGTPELQTSTDYHSIGDIPMLTYHSVCHLFSAIMLDTDKFYHENLIGMSVDLGSDTILESRSNGKHEFAGCVVRKGEVEYFPIYSPGLLWSMTANHYKLQEGSLMALASASTSTFNYTPDLREIDINSIETYFTGLVQRVEQLSAQDAGTLFNGFDPRFSEKENKTSMVMKVIQEVSIQIMEHNIEQILLKYDLDLTQTYLAIAGGYALNCPTNSHLMQKYKFKGFMAPSCVSDCGQSMGVALYAFYKKMNMFQFKYRDAYYGNLSSNLDALIEQGKYQEFIRQVSAFDAQQIVEDIKTFPIVWFNGRAEVGPRALGSRSIIADPRTQEAKDQLNVIKQRQWWRPVAPIVLEEELNDWFIDSYASPFMLQTFDVRSNKLQEVPAILHLDNSARIQTINQDMVDNLLYTVIQAFKASTGVPIICNTSLNDKEEPIIDQIEEAFNFALRKGIKVGYFNGTRIEFQNHENYQVDKPLERKIQVELKEEERDALKREWNPHNVSLDGLTYYFLAEAENKYDLQDKNDARELTMLGRMFMKKIGLY